MPLTYYTFNLKAITNFSVQETIKQTKESMVTTGEMDCQRGSTIR